MTPYAELQLTTNFSFLRGASHPEELVTRAAELGLTAIGVTDRNSLAGVVRTHSAIKFLREKKEDLKLRLVVGTRLDLEDGPSFLCYPIDRPAYGRLCQLLTLGKRRAEKGSCRLTLADVLEGETFRSGHGQVLIVVAPDTLDEAFEESLVKVKSKIKKNLYLSVNFLYFGDDRRRIVALAALAQRYAIALVATNDVHAHSPERRPLQDVLTCIREGCTIHEAGFRLFANAERHLKEPDEMARLFAPYPEAIANTVRIARSCAFSLDELRYEYLTDPVPDGRTPQEELERLAWEGAQNRYPQGVPDKVTEQIKQELQLIGELRYAPYFLTIYNIMEFARPRGILCQGRGSAANSTVCFVLHITEVDPAQTDLLFGRFISTEREEPPDIDVDFEHERREEVIQYLYRKYGRERAALTATVISYRPRSALRDVGKALGFDEAALDALGSGHRWWGEDGLAPERIREAGLDPDSLKVRQLVALTGQLMGFPRHLSQHTGGFVLTRGPLSRLVPIENATMADRTVIEWDKDDLDAMGLLKVDVLALGMLTAIRKSFDFISQRKGFAFRLQDIPDKDEATYDMICAADTVGVFQIESRAQMSMLPRLRPRAFYDLVVEVALVRPGPIQGGAVHPYLNRRQGKEPVDYPKGLEAALERTLGVPVFQEQCMQIAIIAAGFTPGEADGLRRAMGAWRRTGGLGQYERRLVDGMTERGYELAFAQRVVEQVKGFSSYGFPESHAVSFALLVYDSSWIKRHHPAEFLAGLLNSQPLGFYTPSQLVQDAKRHGVDVRPVDVMVSDWDCTLEEVAPPCETPDPLSPWERAGVRATPQPTMPSVRLGLRLISGLSHDEAKRLMSARKEAAFTDSEDLARRAALDQPTMQQLAAADALQSLSGHRRQQVWDAAALKTPPELLKEAPVDEDTLALPEAPEGEAIVWDYASLGLTLRRHPLALLRERLQARRFMTAAALKDAPDGRLVRACGIVTGRQQPETSKGVVFVTLEDETGVVQVIVWKALRERQRSALTRSRLMAVHGVWQREGEVCNLIAGHLEDLTPLLGRLATESRDFH